VNPELVIVGVIAVGLLAYLLYTLIYPERF
jgi:K+-transporting ATPase KdpF subunit